MFVDLFCFFITFLNLFFLDGNVMAKQIVMSTMMNWPVIKLIQHTVMKITLGVTIIDAFHVSFVFSHFHSFIICFNHCFPNSFLQM